MNPALAWIRRRWWLVAALVVMLAGCGWLVASALDDSEDRKQRSVEAAADRRRIEALVLSMTAQQETLLRVAKDIEDATSPAAQARNAAATARAVSDLRRSEDCVSFYFNGERGYPACVDVDRRLDTIRAGGDPFAPATSSADG